jgi:hypothetical protein
MTNFLNSLVCPFYYCQKYFIQTWMTKNKLETKKSHSTKCAINGWECNFPVPDVSKKFIKYQRTVLGLNDNKKISEFWLKCHPNNVLISNIRVFFSHSSPQWATSSYLNFSDALDTFYN